MMLPMLSLFLLMLASPLHAQCPNREFCDCLPGNEGLIINCRRADLTTVPKWKDTTLEFEEITLFDNQITALPETAFKTENGTPLKVRKIDLAKNEITSVSELAFAGMEESLQELRLHVAGMTEYPAQAIGNLNRLQTLYLEGFSLTNGVLPPGSFTQLTEMQNLTIKECGLSSLSASDLIGQRTTLHEFYLPKNKFTSVPRDALATLSALTKLDLQINQLSSLPSRAFSGLNALAELELKQNAFTSIEADALNGIEGTLTKLSLPYTNFHDSHVSALAALDRLTHLDLGHNELLLNPQFRGLDSLEELKLPNTAIKTITPGMFRELGSSLQVLDVSSTGLNNIQDGAFSSLSKLRSLSLSGNPVGESLDGESLNGLGTLESLYLDGTGIKSQGLVALKSLTKLKTLKLVSNSLTSIPPNTFLYLNQLITLDLNANSIQSVSQSSFRGLQNSLQSINLKSNRITSLDSCTFHDFKQLASIKLDANQLNCDCSLKWLRQWLVSGRELIGSCVSPPNHNGKHIRDIPAEEFTCTVTQSPLVCEAYTTPTPLPTAQISVATTTPTIDSPVTVTISSVTSDSFQVTWSLVSDPDISGFTLQVLLKDDGSIVQENSVSAQTLSSPVYSLDAATTYTVCVNVHYGTHAHILDHKACVDVTTEAYAPPVRSDPEKLAIILGSVIGGLVLLFLLIVLIVCLVRHHRKNDYARTKINNSATPQVGYNSKRFSKPKEHDISTLELGRKLEGFSPEERDRILNLLTSSGASTLSMISHASSNRYLKEPTHHYPGGVSNPYPGAANNYPDVGQYSEIPADAIGQYEYIPADQVGKYDYIPADQVQPGAFTEPVPPTPVPRPAGGMMPPLWGEDTLGGQPEGRAVRSKSRDNLSQEIAQNESWI